MTATGQADKSWAWVWEDLSCLQAGIWGAGVVNTAWQGGVKGEDPSCPYNLEH